MLRESVRSCTGVAIFYRENLFMFSCDAFFETKKSKKKNWNLVKFLEAYFAPISPRKSKYFLAPF